MKNKPASWLMPGTSTAPEPAKVVYSTGEGELAAWTRFYVFESFKVRSLRLGSIESHPDFE